MQRGLAAGEERVRSDERFEPPRGLAPAIDVFKEAARFGVVGAAAAGVHYIVGYLLLPVAPATIANAAGFAAAVVFAYHGHRRWTFRGRRAASLGLFARSAVTALTCLGLSQLILTVAKLGLSAPDALALAAAAAAPPPISFLMNRYWVFAAEPPRGGRGARR